MNRVNLRQKNQLVDCEEGTRRGFSTGGGSPLISEVPGRQYNDDSPETVLKLSLPGMCLFVQQENVRKRYSPLPLAWSVDGISSKCRSRRGAGDRYITPGDEPIDICPGEKGKSGIQPTDTLSGSCTILNVAGVFL